MKIAEHESLIAALESIFPKHVGAACMPIDQSFCVEFEEEERCVIGLSSFRKQEFLAGRSCARKAMSRLGLPPLPIVVGEQRVPVWPAGITGSISHTRKHCVAVVAFRDAFRSVGLDIEQHNRLKPHLWRLVLTKRESAWIEGLPEAQRIRIAALIFSAKEAFYKYQFPLTRVWLGFQDAEINVSFEDSTFSLKMLKAVEPQFCAGDRFLGKFSFYEDYVLTGIS